jgi:hypothetical protein
LFTQYFGKSYVDAPDIFKFKGFQLDSLNEGEYNNPIVRSFNVVLIFDLEDFPGVPSLLINLEVFIDETTLLAQYTNPNHFIVNSDPTLNQVQYLQVEENNAMLAEIKTALSFYSPDLKALKIREIINKYL